MTVPLMTLLPQRAVFEVTGEDRGSFLQGLITNDIHTLKPHQSLYAALLTAKGRFLFDLFIKEEEASYLIDAEADRLGELLKKLNLYKLRSKVTLTPRPDLQVFALWGGEAIPGLRPIRGATQGRVLMDPRLVEMGARSLGDPCLPGCHPASLQAYHQHRLSQGIPEGGQDLIPEKTVPLEAGLDELGGISWTKGCYMGQELTARTKHCGILRKRFFPVRIEGPSPSQGSPILQEGEKVGEMLSHSGAYGLALLRLEAFRAEKSFQCEASHLTPYQPGWMVLKDL